MVHIHVRMDKSWLNTHTVESLYSGHPWDSFKCPDLRRCPHFRYVLIEGLHCMQNKDLGGDALLRYQLYRFIAMYGAFVAF